MSGACTSKPAATQLLVTVNSDLRAGSELAEVRAATDAHKLTFYILPSIHSGGLRTKLPFSFRLVPPNGDASKTVELEVEGYDSQQTLLVRRRVRVGFVPHQTRLLALSLTHDCEARFLDCEAKSQTCDRGNCTAVQIDVEKLPSVKPNEELDGIATLPAWCKASSCNDGGAGDATSDTDGASGARGGTGGVVGSKPGDAGGSGGTGGRGTGGGGTGGHRTGGDGTGGEETGDEDTGVGGSQCGASAGFWQDVGVALATTRDGVPCPLIAEDTTRGQPADVSSAAAVEYAVSSNATAIEITVAQQDQTFYQISRFDPSDFTNRVPLADVLDMSVLGSSPQPLLLFVEDPVDSSSAPGLLLDLLLARQTNYAKDCRPAFLVANSPSAWTALETAHDMLGSQTKYAPLRGHLRFGAVIAAASADSSISEMIAHGFEIAEVLPTSTNARAALQAAHAAGLMTITKGENENSMAFCGLADAVINGLWSPDSIWLGTTVHELRMDAAGQSAADHVDYVTNDTTLASATLAGVAQPEVMTGAPGQPLVGEYLHFDSTKARSLSFQDIDHPTGRTSFIVTLLVRFQNLALASGERQVLASKRQGNTGWAIELYNPGTGTQLLFEHNYMVSSAPVSKSFGTTVGAIGLDTLSSHFVHGLVSYNNAGLIVDDGLPWGDPSNSNINDLGGIPLPIENDQPITIGADPDGTNHFEGDIQMFDVTSF